MSRHVASYADGMTHAEIARALGVTKTAIAQSERSGLRKLYKACMSLGLRASDFVSRVDRWDLVTGAEDE